MSAVPTVSDADPPIPAGFIRFDAYAVIDASQVVAVTVPKRTIDGSPKWEVQVVMAAASGSKTFASALFSSEVDAVDLWTRTLDQLLQARA